MNTVYKMCGLLILAVLTPVATGATARLECISDATVRAGKSNDGTSQELTVQGRTQLAMLQFRVSVIPDWQVESATLYLHREDLSPLSKLGLGAVPAAWRESVVSYEEGTPEVPWPGKGLKEIATGKLLSVHEEESGWISIAVPRELMQRIVAGQAFGFVLYGGRFGGEVHFSSRESYNRAPFLKVEGTPREPVR